MTSTATTRNRLEKQGTGDNTNTWGTRLNSNVFDLIDSALDGRVTFTLSGSKTLSSTNYAADESRMRFIDITSGSGGTVTIPSVEKLYFVRNATSGTVTVTTGAGTSATIAAGDRVWIVCNGTDCYSEVRLDYGSSQLVSSAVPTANSHVVNKLYADNLAYATALPNQTGNSGKFVTTDGSNASWAALPSDWTEITNAAPSGTSQTFSSISQTYSDILLVFENVGCGPGIGTANVQIALSNNGSGYSTALNISGNITAASYLNGYIRIPGYRKSFGGMESIIAIGSPALVSPATNAATPLAAGWDVTSGIAYVRISITGGTAPAFGSGTIRVFGR